MDKCSEAHTFLRYISTHHIEFEIYEIYVPLHTAENLSLILKEGGKRPQMHTMLIKVINGVLHLWVFLAP